MCEATSQADKLRLLEQYHQANLDEIEVLRLAGDPATADKIAAEDRNYHGLRASYLAPTPEAESHPYSSSRRRGCRWSGTIIDACVSRERSNDRMAGISATRCAFGGLISYARSAAPIARSAPASSVTASRRCGRSTRLRWPDRAGLAGDDDIRAIGQHGRAEYGTIRPVDSRCPPAHRCPTG